MEKVIAREQLVRNPPPDPAEKLARQAKIKALKPAEGTAHEHQIVEGAQRFFQSRRGSAPL